MLDNNKSIEYISQYSTYSGRIVLGNFMQLCLLSATPYYQGNTYQCFHHSVISLLYKEQNRQLKQGKQTNPTGLSGVTVTSPPSLVTMFNMRHQSWCTVRSPWKEMKATTGILFLFNFCIVFCPTMKWSL